MFFGFKMLTLVVTDFLQKMFYNIYSGSRLGSECRRIWIYLNEDLFVPLIGYILNVISSHFSNVIQIPIPYVAVIQIGTDGI